MSLFPVDKLLPAVGSAPRIVPGLWPWTRGKSNRTRSADACPYDRCPRLRRGDATPSWRECKEDGDEDRGFARHTRACGGSGCAQDGDHSDGSPVRGRRRARDRDTLLQHAGERSRCHGLLAGGPQRRGGGHGGDRGVLAGAVRGAGGSRDRGDPGACAAGQAVEGAQNRCGRQRLAGLRVPVRALHAEPCAAQAVPGVACVEPPAPGAGKAAGHGAQPRAEDHRPRRCAYRRYPEQYLRSQRSHDPRRAGSRPGTGSDPRFSHASCRPQAGGARRGALAEPGRQ